MKKLFTSVMAALCLAAPVGTLSAQQTQLTEAQKEAFKKEVLPVVFEQIKEQAGIDILGWANPQLSNTFAGIPVLESSSLRAAATDPMTVHPDSVVVDLASMGLDASSIPLVGSMIGNSINITFEGYETKTLPLITAGTHPITIDLPQTIKVIGAAGTLASVKFESPEGSTKLIDVDVTLSLFDSDDMSYNLMACSLELGATADLIANVDIKDGMNDLLEMANLMPGLIPDSVKDGLSMDYEVTVGLSKLMQGSIPASLYAISNDLTGVRAPMGTAVVTLNPTNTFPISKIDVVNYENAAPKDTTLFNLNMSVSNQLYTLKVDKSSIEEGDTTKTQITTIDMSGEGAGVILGSVQSMINSVVTRTVSQLANEGEATWFEMNVSNQTVDGSGLAGKEIPVVDVTVSPYVSGANAIADIDITTYAAAEENSDDEYTSTTYTVRATADLTSKVIAVDVMNGETTYGTAYFTSNASDIITANEDIAEEASAIRIIPTDNGVRVLNVDRAEYQIVSMTGSTVARGVVSGDETISTANLPKGIYVIAVDQNGDREVVKFVR